MIWWWKLKLKSPDGDQRQRAIDKLIASLEDRREDRQRDAATLLATIGHPRAVRRALDSLADHDCAEWSARLLEQIITDFPHALDGESLERIAVLGDPLQTIAAAPLSMGGKKLPSSWQNYQSIDCSALRQKAETELGRRVEAEARWREADEERKRKAAAVKPTRRTA